MDEVTPRKVSNKKPCTIQCLCTGKYPSSVHISLFTVVVCFDIIVSVFFFSCGEICFLDCKLKQTGLIEGRNFWHMFLLLSFLLQCLYIDKYLKHMANGKGPLSLLSRRKNRPGRCHTTSLDVSTSLHSDISKYLI